ncbi:MAG: anion transporter [Calditrichia bacterium]
MQLMVALVIIVLSLIGISIGRFPYLRMNRSTIALVGATMLLLSGICSLEEAKDYIDFPTIIILFSIMIINANIKFSGFFDLVVNYFVKNISSPKKLLALLIILSGFLSALFLNDTIVLVFTPMVLMLAGKYKIRPVPYLIALATSANIGSAATLIGNPQNILIASYSGIPFDLFLWYQLPVTLLSLLVVYVVVILYYSLDFKNKLKADRIVIKTRLHKPLLIKATVATIGMISAMLLGASMAVTAMCAASLLLITRRIKPSRVYREIDWSLLVFFSSLFVITGVVQTLIPENFWTGILVFKSGSATLDLSAVSLIASNVVSNVPAVLLLSKFIHFFGEGYIPWLVLSMSSTFAGNLTLVGSVANLIVAESAAQQGVHLGFGEYLKAGIPITLISIAIGVLYYSTAL